MATLASECRRLFDRYYWHTAVLIAQNSLARQYRNSFLGMLWTLLQPLSMVLVYAVVMPLIMRFPTPNYVLYIVVSLPLWGFLSSSLISASGAIVSQSETLKRCMISTTVFPLADVLKNFYTYCLSFLTMYVVIAPFSGPFREMVFLMPVFLLPVLISVMALSIGISYVAPYVRDVGEVLFVVMNVCFWLTPVVYAIEVIPADMRGGMFLNPFFDLIHPIQDVAYYNRFPGAGAIGAQLLVMLLSIAVGYAAYRAARRNYVYYL